MRAVKMIAHIDAGVRSAAMAMFRPSRAIPLQRQCACGGWSGLTGTCSECEKKKLVVQPRQTNLPIDDTDEEYEQEADRVAEQVMKMSDTLPMRLTR